jgi:hypothetical protein
MAGNRTWRCVLALVAGTLALLAGGLALYARHAVLASARSRPAPSARSPRTRSATSSSTASPQRIVDAQPELADQRPELDAAAGRTPCAARSSPASSTRGAAALHRELFTDRRAPRPAGDPRAGASVRADFLARVRTSSPRRSRPSRGCSPPTDPQLMALGGGRLETGLRDAAPWGRRLAALWPFALAAARCCWPGGAPRSGAPARAAPRGAGRGAPAAARRGRHDDRQALLLSTFDTSHGDAVVGTIWNAYLGDLRLWGLAVGAGALVLAALAEPGTRGDWRRALAAPGAPARGSRGRAPRGRRGAAGRRPRGPAGPGADRGGPERWCSAPPPRSRASPHADRCALRPSCRLTVP